jgi:hypothetical protein
VTPTRPGTLLAVAAICAALAWVLVRKSFAALPPLPWTALPAMLLVAIGEVTAGRNIKARISGRRTTGKPLQPIAVARMVALAKAGSSAAAVLGGLAAGVFLYVGGQLDKDVPKHDAIAAGVTFAGAVVLVAASLYLERCCRAPRPPDDTGADAPDDRHAGWR